VSQSTPHSSPDRAVVFQENGELAEFVDLLSELAVPVEERSTAAIDFNDLEGARLIAISGRQLIEAGPKNVRQWPRTIAVIDDSSRTLVTHLSRIGVSMVIRRPIHPRALRLLLLHEIYTGPERRVRRRILIGHPIRIIAGLFRHQATLLELSSTGARVEAAHSPKVGASIKLLVGKDLTNGKPIKLNARVIRSLGSSTKQNRIVSEFGVSILSARRHEKTIKAILARFSLGPASWKSTPRPSELASLAASRAAVETAKNVSSRTLPPAHESIRIEEVPHGISPAATDALSGTETPPAPIVESLQAEVENSNALEAASSELANGSADRRRDSRIAYDRHVLALGDEAARVLVGRDLSARGMRIAATPTISVGDTLHVALHVGTQTKPLVVVANALRDDGEAGIVLNFEDLTEQESEQLDEIVASGLPIHASADPIDEEVVEDESIVVAEVIGSVGPKSDAEVEAYIESVFDTREPVEDVR
jgi:hypothetical protein